MKQKSRFHSGCFGDRRHRLFPKASLKHGGRGRSGSKQPEGTLFVLLRPSPRSLMMPLVRTLPGQEGPCIRRDNVRRDIFTTTPLILDKNNRKEKL